VLEELPGCRLAATLDHDDGTAFISHRDGRSFNLTVVRNSDDELPAAGLLPSIVYLLDIGALLEAALGSAVFLQLGRAVSKAWISAPRPGPE
jgi:hypothetical protein